MEASPDSRRSALDPEGLCVSAMPLSETHVYTFVFRTQSSYPNPTRYSSTGGSPLMKPLTEVSGPNTASSSHGQVFLHSTFHIPHSPKHHPLQADIFVNSNSPVNTRQKSKSSPNAHFSGQCGMGMRSKRHTRRVNTTLKRRDNMRKYQSFGAR